MKYKFGIFIVMSILSPLILKGQYINNWEARPSLGFNYKVNDRINWGGTYYLSLNDNLSKYEKSAFSSDISYKLINGLKLAIDYRFNTFGVENFHDIRYQMNISQALGNDLWRLDLRPAVQHKIYQQDQSGYFGQTVPVISVQMVPPFDGLNASL